ncbi:exosortase A [Massilia antarctica]|uniref:exosortase A n=1 Tax=Massilia antarctica TaxID=2765360 RepID=UPI0006BB5BE0|nr:exosortase A [Massilia sp. H27-R4]MCY0912013.1 exosortase A [Massilia sp. H27-R4]CUI06523.1 Eight transmembrane protein EpsH / EpsI protein [Janthinobacterium sp. CG23_2]CUU30309.1 Eight transmembrane protein EpsH / EpsI protein [Janthinobacterium sp. CG23_2]
MTLNPARPAQSYLPQMLLIGAVLLFPFLAYFKTAASIVAIWDSSGTFAHGYVILPISLWLIWGRRDALRAMPVQPCWPALALLAACGAAWLLGEMGEVQIVRHYAFVAMLPLSALAILGWPIARSLAFPLAFILFAVPFGDVFSEPLINSTANFTVDALVATGIPVFREGNSFSIPTGNWSVVEACSGVRYLISSVTLGCLYAYLTYRTTWRRALFIVASIIVPIFANGARAYLIVMIGHLSGMTLAVGFDHLIYGWVFFGFVMFLLFWIGAIWREDTAPAADAPVAPALPDAPPAPMARLLPAALAIIACVGVWPAYNYYLEKTEAAPAPVVLTEVRTAAPRGPVFVDWTPAFPTASAELQQFHAPDGQPVGFKLLYYRKPPEGTKLITTTNRLSPVKDPVWRTITTVVRDEAIGARGLRLRESSMSGPSGKMLVWHWYWIDGSTTSNDYVGKLLQIRQKLVHASDDGAAVMIFAPYDENPEPARVAMRAFLKGDLAAIEAALAANTRHR